MIIGINTSIHIENKGRDLEGIIWEYSIYTSNRKFRDYVYIEWEYWNTM